MDYLDQNLELMQATADAPVRSPRVYVTSDGIAELFGLDPAERFAESPLQYVSPPSFRYDGKTHLMLTRDFFDVADNYDFSSQYSFPILADPDNPACINDLLVDVAIQVGLDYRPKIDVKWAVAALSEKGLIQYFNENAQLIFNLYHNDEDFASYMQEKALDFLNKDVVERELDHIRKEVRRHLSKVEDPAPYMLQEVPLLTDDGLVKIMEEEGEKVADVIRPESDFSRPTILPFIPKRSKDMDQGDIYYLLVGMR
jgi:hypothetical protein